MSVYAVSWNLRRFGGKGAPVKKDLLRQLLIEMREKYRPVVAGLSEITNDGAAVKEVGALLSPLLVGEFEFVVPEVGKTHSGSEYLAIGWKKEAITVSSIGIVHASPHTPGKFTCQEQVFMPGRPNQCNFTIPHMDTRGIPFIRGHSRTGAPLVFGFFHNMHTAGLLEEYVSNLGKIASMLNGPGPGRVVIGGDFNCTAATQYNSYGHSCVALDPSGAPSNTTMSHAIDWWYVNDGPTNEDAVLGPSQIDAGPPPTLWPSDHYPILLKL